MVKLKENDFQLSSHQNMKSSMYGVRWVAFEKARTHTMEKKSGASPLKCFRSVGVL